MIKILACGKVKDQSLKSLINEYVKRIKHYYNIEIIDTNDQKIVANDSYKHIKDLEAKDLLAKIKDSDFVVVLDLKGRELDSIELSNMIDRWLSNGRDIVFVIGGSLGLGEEVLKRADYHLCLSKLTFLHQMSKLILLEQIYRSFKILHHETYHK